MGDYDPGTANYSGQTIRDTQEIEKSLSVFQDMILLRKRVGALTASLSINQG